MSNNGQCQVGNDSLPVPSLGHSKAEDNWRRDQKAGEREDGETTGKPVVECHDTKAQHMSRFICSVPDEERLAVSECCHRSSRTHSVGQYGDEISTSSLDHQPSHNQELEDPAGDSPANIISIDSCSTRSWKTDDDATVRSSSTTPSSFLGITETTGVEIEHSSAEVEHSHPAQNSSGLVPTAEA